MPRYQPPTKRQKTMKHPPPLTAAEKAAHSVDPHPSTTQTAALSLPPTTTTTTTATCCSITSPISQYCCGSSTAILMDSSEEDSAAEEETVAEERMMLEAPLSPTSTYSNQRRSSLGSPLLPKHLQLQQRLAESMAEPSEHPLPALQPNNSHPYQHHHRQHLLVKLSETAAPPRGLESTTLLAGRELEELRQASDLPSTSPKAVTAPATDASRILLVDLQTDSTTTTMESMSIQSESCITATEWSNTSSGQESSLQFPDGTSNSLQVLSQLFRAMPTKTQDQFLRHFAHECCTKKQLSFLANLILPQLRMDILRHLPHEIALHVLSYLPIRSLCRLASTSKYHQGTVSDNHLWRNLCIGFRFLPISYALQPANNEDAPDFRRIFRSQYMIRTNWQRGFCTHFAVEGPRNAIVTSLQFNNDILAIATDNSEYGLIDIFDSHTGTRVRQLTGHEGGVWALEFRGDMLLSGGCDRDLRVWDLQTGECKHRLVGHTSTVRCLKMVDEERCVTGSRDHTIRLWDVVKGECLRVFRGHGGSIRCISAHGNRIVSGSYDNTLRVWDLDQPEAVHVLQEHHAQIYSCAFDGRFVCSGSLDADIRIWDAQTGQCLWTLEGHDALVGHMQLIGNTLVTGGSDGRICVWDVRTGEFLKRISAHANSVTTLQFSEERIVSGGDDGIKIWDFKTGRLVRSVMNNVTGVWRLQFNFSKLIAAVQRGENTAMEIMDFDMEHAMFD